MEIKHTDDGSKGIFYIEEDGKRIAFMTYVHAGPGKFIIDHTIVEPGNEGKGLGKQLVEAGVVYAQKNHMKIIPICSFAKKVFDNTPEYAEVLF